MDLTEWSAVIEAALHRPPLIRANGKAPLDTGWTTEPFDDPDGWRSRLHGHTTNVGMVTGRGLLVVDGDIYKPGCALDALLDDMGLTRHTVTALTGGGGQHLLYAYDPTLSVPSIPLGPLGYPGVELKADGGQIIVEPSVHPDTGRPYCWEIGYGPGEIPPTPATTAFLELVGAIPARGRRRHARWQPLDAGDDLDEVNVEAARLLVEHFAGHDPVRTSGGEIGVYRPGKTDGSAGITIGYIAPGVAKCWTDGWPPFEQGKVYDVAQLRHMAGITPTIHVPDALVLPDGYRLWREGDDDRPWPVLASAARHGLVGQYLDLVEEQTEASVAAVGAMLLTQIGTLIGRRAAIWIGEHHHHPNLFTLIVGGTSTGAKGSADTTVGRIVDRIDGSFAVRHVIGGFGSGEAVIHEVRDDDEEPVEKRRVIIESEFAAVLRVARREQSILSQVIRQAFDYKPLQHRTKTYGKIIATGHHLSVIGSITPKELAASSTELDIENGWLNRFLFIHSAVTRVLPFGGQVDSAGLAAIAGKIGNALAELDTRIAVGGSVNYFIRDDGGSVAELWAPWYSKVRFGTGTIPALTKRQHVHVPRLALILAVLDRTSEITVDHLQAGMAWSEFSVATVEHLFGTSVVGKAAHLLQAIRESGRDGLDGAGQDRVFSGNVQVGELRAELEEKHLIVSYKVPTPGRPRTVSVAVTPLRINGFTDKG